MSKKFYKIIMFTKKEMKYSDYIKIRDKVLEDSNAKDVNRL